MENLRYSLGLDIGIGSVGWAVIQNDVTGEPIKIIDLGVRIFDRAEHPKTGASLAEPRRSARSARRSVRRRRHRKERIKYLFETVGIMSRSEIETLYETPTFKESVYALRVEALDRVLTREELIRVLLHMAQRRGYQSNSKAEAARDKEAGKVKTAISENKQRMEENGYRTVGEMLWMDNAFQEKNPDGTILRRLRNTPDAYKITVERSMVVDELKQIFAAQQKFGSPYVNENFSEEYLRIFQSQRNFDEGPGGNSPFGSGDGSQTEKMLGKCTFEKVEYRAAKATYTFEYFRLLQAINHEKIVGHGLPAEPLNKEQREAYLNLVMKSPGATYAQLRKALALDSDCYFNSLYYGGKTVEEQEKKKLNQMQSYHKIRTALDKVQKGVIKTIPHDQLDDIGRILTLYKSDDKRKVALKTAEIPDAFWNALLELSASKAGNLSIKAMKKLIPYLEQGETYDKACAAVYGDQYGKSGKCERKSRLSLVDIEPINNPVVRRAVGQSIKVVNSVIRTYGAPEVVRVELAREMSRTHEERNKADKRMQENQKRNEYAKEQIKEYKSSEPTGLDIVKFRLYEEQGGVCLYSGKNLDIGRLFEAGYVDVDHIIPYSISFDDSYSNKVLVLSSENRQKGNRIPYQYFGGDEERWHRFEVLAKAQISSFTKRKNLLLKKLSEAQIDGFKKRNLVDTQYLSRVVYRFIEDHLEFAETGRYKKRTQSVNGAITAQIRKRLGIYKIREDGDLHHAADAAVIACISPGMIQKVTNYAKQCESVHQTKDGYLDSLTGELMTKEKYDQTYEPKFPPPWPLFRKELEARLSENPRQEIDNLRLSTYDSDEELKPVFVSRMPNHKVSGAAHADTIRSGKKEGYTVSKKPLNQLKLDKQGEIDGYYNPESDRLLYEALKGKLLLFGGDGKKAFSEPFYKPKADGTPGSLVNKVKIFEKSTSNVAINNGLAANGSMVRVDVFYVAGDGYYFVPIYTADTIKKQLPSKAVVASKSQDKWKEMMDDHFIFSLYSGDLIYIKSKKGVKLKLNKGGIGQKERLQTDGLYYYKGSDISTASFNIQTHDRRYDVHGLGIKTLQSIEKYQVDVLGNIFKVHLPEKRMPFWKGKKEE